MDGLKYYVQLRPTTIPKWTINNNNSHKGGSLLFGRNGISCPLGTVVVKRTTQEDLIQSQLLKSMGSKYSISKGENIDLTGFHVSNHTNTLYSLLNVEQFLTYNDN